MNHVRRGKAYAAVLAVAVGGLMVLAVAGCGEKASANSTPTSYTMTVTDITNGELFAPVIAATQMPGNDIYTPGQPASSQLAHLAITGDPSQLVMLLKGDSSYGDVETNNNPKGPTNPGGSTGLTLTAGSGFTDVTVAAMLVPTNDVFFAIQDKALPTESGETIKYTAPAYEAGAVQITENCSNIAPVPSGFHDLPCMNTSFTPIFLTPPSYVRISGGIFGVNGGISTSELNPSLNDWNNPVALITITAN